MNEMDKDKIHETETIFTVEVGPTKHDDSYFTVGVGRGNLPWAGKQGSFGCVGTDLAIFQTGSHDYVYLSKRECLEMAVAFAKAAARMKDRK
jgi:hypothetical protein